MIISHKHKFIFFKTKKTAGTSIEIVLSRYCNGKDIITPVDKQSNIVRRQLGIKPKNFRESIFDVTPKQTLYAILTASNKNLPKKYYNHMIASELRRIIKPNLWDSYFKFTIERNPWDKAVSAYHYHIGVNKEDITFEEFIEKYNYFRNFHRYTIEGRVAVDFIIKYENLQDDLTKALQKVGIEYDGWLPNAKGGFRKEKKKYKDCYSNCSKDRVADLCKDEIELFSYEF